MSAIKRKSGPDASKHSSQSKKRRRSGLNFTADESSPQALTSTLAESPPGDISRDALLNEIRDLGGDEEDLQLVLDAPSQSEDEHEESVPPLPHNFHTELAEFAGKLGFSQPVHGSPPVSSVSTTAAEPPLASDGPSALPTQIKGIVCAAPLVLILQTAHSISRCSNRWLSGTLSVYQISRLHSPTTYRHMRKPSSLSKSMRGHY